MYAGYFTNERVMLDTGIIWKRIFSDQLVEFAMRDVALVLSMKSCST